MEQFRHFGSEGFFAESPLSGGMLHDSFGDNFTGVEDTCARNLNIQNLYLAS